MCVYTFQNNYTSTTRNSHVHEDNDRYFEKIIIYTVSDNFLQKIS